MRPLIAIPIAAMILVGGWYLSDDPSRLGPVFDFLDEYTEGDQGSAPIVPMQDDERWLVVVVDFPNAPENGFRNVEKAELIMTGTKGADDYISQTTGGKTTLSVTILSNVYHAQKKVIDEKSPKEFSFISSNNGQQPWGIRLVDNEIWLHSGELIDSDLEIRFIE